MTVGQIDFLKYYPKVSYISYPCYISDAKGCVCMFICISIPIFCKPVFFFNFSWIYPQEQHCCYTMRCILNRKFLTFQSGFFTVDSHQRYENSSLITSLPTFSCDQSLISAILLGTLCYLIMIFICNLTISADKPLKICLLTICIYPFLLFLINFYSFLICKLFSLFNYSSLYSLGVSHKGHIWYSLMFRQVLNLIIPISWISCFPAGAPDPHQ